MNILVLDDEKEIADLVELYLKNEDYNVFKFYDSNGAIKCINSQKLDFAILDVMIKDISNEVQARVKEAMKKTADLEVKEVNIRIKNITSKKVKGLPEPEAQEETKEETAENNENGEE